MRPEGVLIFEGGEWVPSPSPSGPHTRFAEIRSYRSNLIGYARGALCLAAGATITTAHPLVTAGLLLAAILLDWVDGPVARAYRECTVFGSGVDWSSSPETRSVRAASGSSMSATTASGTI